MSEKSDDLREISHIRAALVGAEIRGERNRAALSQTGLAEAADMSLYKVQTVEKGAVDLEDLLILCGVLGVDAPALLTRALGRPLPGVRIHSPQTVRDLRIKTSGNVGINISQA